MRQEYLSQEHTGIYWEVPVLSSGFTWTGYFEKNDGSYDGMTQMVQGKEEAGFIMGL